MAYFSSKLGILGTVRSLELNLDSAISQHFVGESSHAPDQIRQTIAFWIDRPDDIAHGRYRLTGNAGDRRQRRCHAGICMVETALSYLAQNRNLRQVRPNIVV